MIRKMRVLRWHESGFVIRPSHVVYLLAGVFAAVLLGVLSDKAHAETPGSIGFAVSPPTFEISANPGDTITNSIRVDNLTQAPLRVMISTKDFVPVGEEGQAALTDEKTEYSLSTWVKPATNVLDIPAKGSKTVDFSIMVPLHAEPGGHFGSIVFQTKPDAQPNGTGVTVGQEIGSLLLLKVAGKVTEKASMVGFGPSQSVWQKGPIDFAARVKNDGNVQLKPTGTITINNIFGNKVASVPIDSQTVLPNSVRKLNSQWKGSAWPGWYTATASVGYGADGRMLTATSRFVLFPYKIILPVLLIVVVLGLYFYRVRKRLARAVRILAGKE